MSTHVLIVEDNPGDVRLIEMMLQEAASTFEWQVVGNMAGALDMLDRNAFDVVLLDLSLPDSQGLETVQSVRQHHRDIALVVLTGASDTQTGVEALQAGAQDYLMKNATNTGVLSRVLRYALGRAEIERAERQQRQLANALLDIGRLVTSTLDLDEVARRILLSLDMIVDHDHLAFLILQNEHTVDAMYIRQGKAESIETIYDADIELRDYDFLDRIMTERKMQISSSQKLDFPIGPPLSAEQDCIGFPIIQRASVDGILLICIRHGQDISEDLQHRLSMFSQQVAIALANAHLYDQSREAARLKERQRIARELHDSVTQTLFTMMVMAESAIIQWDRNTAKSRTLVEEVHELAQAVLAEMRVLLLELRPQYLAREPLHKLIEQLVTSLKPSHEMVYQLDLTPIPQLDTEIKEVFYRIIQEGLNNVIKHARATEVNVTLKLLDEGIYAEVVDNGDGFDANKVKPGIGLRSMRERAEDAGVVLDLQTGINNGTVLCISWNPDNVDEEQA